MSSGTFRKVVLAVVLSSSLGACATGRVIDAAVGERGIRDMASVPAGYQTYTLFISTSYDYAGLGKAATVNRALSDRFDRFSKAIGENNYAAFVSDPSTRTLDVAAGRSLLDRVNGWYRLSNNYTNGPYIIVLQRHPNTPPSTEDAAIISLAGQSRDQVLGVLDELQSELEVQRSTAPAGVSFESFWLAVKKGWTASGGTSVRAVTSILVATPEKK